MDKAEMPVSGKSLPDEYSPLWVQCPGQFFQFLTGQVISSSQRLQVMLHFM
jgi:hypothetical protein